MLLAIDVYYKEQSAKVVGALFYWEDQEPINVLSCDHHGVLPYESGSFYKRELPCILTLLRQVNLDDLSAIIIDGHCFLSNDKKYGLGAYLWEAIDKKVPVIGVAKKGFYDAENVLKPVLRGESKIPLYVSTVDFDLTTAMEKVKHMHGKYRIPNILKIVDRETRV